MIFRSPIRIEFRVKQSSQYAMGLLAGDEYAESV